AGIDNGTKITVREDGSLGGISITATHSAEERVSAKAGSAGGISVTPVLALNISGMNTRAYLGTDGETGNTPTDRPLVATGDIVIASSSNVYREIASNAAAAGGKVGFGAAPGITVYNDSSYAGLRRSVRANNVKVTSSSISRVKSTSRASSNGAQSGTSSSGTSSTTGDAASAKGQSDQQADKSIGGASKLAGSTGSSNISPGMISNLTANRQTAQTSEGNIQIAAAFNLNVMKNSSIAAIEGNITTTAAGDIEVSSIGETDAKIYANASATQSKTGIGAAVAINIVSYTNKAVVEQAALTAGGDISVTAEMPEEGDTKVATNNGAKTELQAWIEKQADELIQKACETMGLEEQFGDSAAYNSFKSAMANLVSDLGNGAWKTLTVGTPLASLTELDIRNNPSNLRMLKDLLASNIVEQVKTNSQNMLKNMGKIVTTNSLDALFTWLEVDIKQSNRGPTSEFVTEAIAGAGASNVGVAGSVAIDVINGSVKAIVGDSAGVVIAGGDIVVDADARQSESTTASAAVGSDGKADKNLTQSGATSGTTADQAAGTDGDLILSAATGGTYKAVRNGNTVTVTLTALEGYEAGGVTAVITQSGAAVSVTQGASSNVFTFTMPTLEDGETVTVSVTFKEKPHTITIMPMIPGPTSTNTEYGNLYVTTPSATGEKGAAGTVSGTTTAKMGDKVTVRVAPAAGKIMTAGSLKYTYTSNDTPKTVTIVNVENAGNNTYSFYMPDADITISVIFQNMSAEQLATAAQQPPKTNQGKSIGVGAAFALDIVNLEVEAGIGKNRSVTGRSVSITAVSDHYRTTAAVSGTDPISGDNASGVSNTTGTTGTTGTTTNVTVKTKDISVDAAVAIGLTDVAVKAYVDEGAVIKTTGTPPESINEETEGTELVARAGDFLMAATAMGRTMTQASGFAAGGSTAVGAAVAINIADSDVLVSFNGTGAEITGNATLKSYTYNEDESNALATAVGADIERYLSKFNTTLDTAEDKTNKVLNGDYQGLRDNNTNNNTATTVNGSLNNNSNNSNQSGQSGRQQANNNLSASSNVLNTQNVSTESTGDGSKAGGAANTANQQNQSNSSGKGGSINTQNASPAKSIQVAAAVGLNITNHRAVTQVNGSIDSAKQLMLLSDNDGNFRVLGTGATMTLGNSSLSIAMGVAISVNNNKAIVQISDSTVSSPIVLKGAEGVTIDSQLSQNMDGDFRGYIAAQALAGSVTGTANAAIAGAVSILVSKAETRSSVGQYAVIVSDSGDVTVTAADKSKLAVRAGGYSISTRGAKVGIGASFAFIYAYNDVIAEVRDNASIKGKNLTVTATKIVVSREDYNTALGMDELITRSDGTTVVPKTEQGIIHMTKSGTGSDAGYKVNINLSTDTLLDAVDLLNFLGSVNYYAEAISGAVSGGTGTFSGAGSFAMVFFFNETQAMVGNNVNIILTGDAGEEGMVLAAIGDTNARIIAGSLSASRSNVGVGLTVGFLYDEDEVSASVGNNTRISTAGSYLQKAQQSMDALVITVAASAAGGTNSSAIGGNFTAIVMENEAEAAVGNSSYIEAGGDATIAAQLTGDLTLIAASAAVSGGNVAAGGTLNVTVTESEAETSIGDGSSVISNTGSVNISADTTEKLTSIMASASAALGGSGTSVAGVLSVLVTDSKTRIHVGQQAVIKALKDINILADAASTLLQINASLSVGTRAAVGAIVNVNVLERVISTIIEKAVQITAEQGNVLIQSTADESILLVDVAAGASGSNGLTGVIPVIVKNSTVLTQIADSTQDAPGRITAGDSIGVIADGDSQIYLIAGGLAVAGSSAVGATISTAVVKNDIQVDIGVWTIMAAATSATASSSSSGGIKTPNREDKRKGVIISATGQEDIIMISVSAGAGTQNAITGVINTLVVKNIVKATVREHTTISVAKQDGTGQDDDDPLPGVYVEAADDTDLLNLAGSLSVAGNVGVGATVVALVFNKTVTAQILGGQITCPGDVVVSSDAQDEIWLLAIAFGAAGKVGVAGGANVLVFQNEVHAILGGTVGTTGNKVRNVTVQAASDSKLINIGVTAGIGGTAGVSAVVVVTYFYNETLVYIREASKIYASGDVKVRANSKEYVSADAAGAAVGGTAGVGGTADIVITKVITKAYTENDVVIEAGSLTVSAVDDYEFLAIAATLAGGGTAGVGVTVLVSVAYNTVAAEIGENNKITATGDVTVSARSDREVKIYTGSFGGGVTAGVAGTVSVVVVGSKLSEDAHNAIYVNNTEGKNENDSSMDPQKQTDHVFENAHGEAQGHRPNESMDDLLASDGNNAEDVTENGSGYGQDVKDDTGDEKETTSDAFMNDTTYDKTAKLDNKKETTGAVINNNGVLEELKDTTSAIINSGTTIEAGGNLTVKAIDTLSVDLIAGSFAIGGTAGVGVGVAVAILNSNVQALVESGTTLIIGGDVLVYAQAGAAETTIEDRKSDVIQVKGDGGNSSSMTSGDINQKVKDEGISDSNKSTIRVISVTLGAGGYAGVSVAAAVLTVNSGVKAIMAGDVQKAEDVTVEASMNYGTVITATLAVGGGLAGVTGSLGVTLYTGTIETAINGTAKLTNITGIITVKTTGTTNATSVASGIAVGAAGVNAGSATAINKTKIDTYVGQGVIIDAPQADLKLSTDFTSDARTFVIGLAAGGVAVGATVSISINKMTALTYIGLTPYGEPQPGSAGSGGYVNVKSVDVQNLARGEVSVKGMGVTGGTVAINGIVAIGMNRVIGYGAINKMSVTAAEYIAVTANMEGNVTVSTTAITAGMVAAGATVALSQIKTDNRAMIDTDGAQLKAGSITVQAGTADKPYTSQAITSVITGSVGSYVVAVNYGKAYNDAGNRALITGTTGGIEAGALNVSAYGNTRAYAIIANASGGAITANISVAQAELRSVQEAKIDSSGTIRLTADGSGGLTGSLNVVSQQNCTPMGINQFQLIFGEIKADDNGENGCGANTLTMSFTNMAEAYIFSAAAGLAVVNANGLTAKTNATSTAEVSAGSITADGAITVTNTGISTANAKADNLSFGLVAVGVNVSIAEAKGNFNAGVNSTGSIQAADITVSNTYTSNAQAQTSQAKGGASAALVEVKTNVADAKVTTIAKAYLSGTGDITGKDIQVITRGTANAYAFIEPAKVTISGAYVAVAVVTAELKAEQTTYLEGATIKADSLLVRSMYNVEESKIGYEGEEPKIPDVNTNYGAVAKVGASVASVSLASAQASTANALSDSMVKTYVKGARTDISGDLTVDTFATSYAKAEVLKPTVAISLVDVGVVLIWADANGDYSAYIDTTGSTAGNGISAGNMIVAVGYQTRADAITGPGGGAGVKIGLASFDANAAVATAATKAKAYVTGNGILKVTSGDLIVIVKGKAIADASVITEAVSISILDVAVNTTTATVNVAQYAAMEFNGTGYVEGNMIVKSIYDIGSANNDKGAHASVGTLSGSGVEISLVSAGVATATATSRVSNKAYVKGSGNIRILGDLTVFADTNSKAEAIANKPTTINLARFCGLFAKSISEDTTESYITGINADGKLTILADGKVDVEAKGVTTSSATSAQGSSGSLLSGSVGFMEAHVGTSSKKQTVKAYIGDHTDITATKDIRVISYNEGNAVARITSGWDVAGITITYNNVPTKGYYYTESYIGANAAVKSIKGSIILKASDLAKADSKVDGNAVGILCNADSKYARNTVDQRVLVQIKAGADLYAYDDIIVQAESNAEMKATTHAEGGGMFSAGTLQAYNTLTRDVDIIIRENAALFADFGEIRIAA
ncbi:MAG: hypothetical protein Q4C25_04495, partial [Bacillota bacterium]|nr:hypothetical protein [Bacillota bacterium]